jgi:hypothetical protein
MNHHTYYFWSGSRVLGVDTISTAFARDAVVNLLCLDTSCSEPTQRYGRLTNHGWQYVPLESFPKEFRTNLLLLGVT